MTWLITGATGLLGANASLIQSTRRDVVATSRRAPAFPPVPFLSADLMDPGSRDGLVEKSQASVVLHTAALSSIEACERNPELARSLNIEATADLASQARRAGATFVYISTDAVFDGRTGCYTELSAPSPTTEYGRTKLAGEAAALDEHPSALVARVNFYGWSPSGNRSLAEFFYNRLAKGQLAPGFQDVIVSTLYVGILIDILDELVVRGASGVLNTANDESISKFDLGRSLAAAAGFDTDLVTPSRSTEHLAITRGTRLDLDTTRLRGLRDGTRTDQQEGIDRFIADRRAGLAESIAAFAV